MKLVPAGGSSQMQRALAHQYARTIATIISQYPELLTIVASILKAYDQREQSGLANDLNHILQNQSRPGNAGLNPPGHVVELVQTLRNLYQQHDEDIRYQRGAILEILAHSLVSPRYQPGECLSDYRFVGEHGEYVTEQIDVAALSQSRKWVEGYECKLKANSIESMHCTGLTYLSSVAQNEEYRVNVGFVALDDERVILRRITRLFPSPVLNAYGLYTIWLLRNNPF